MKELKIALAQIPVTADIAANLHTILGAIRFAEEQSADILLTPEGSLSGYTHEFNRESMQEALREVERSAKKAGIGLALGTCGDGEDGKCHNQLRFYDKNGTFLGYHSKTLLCRALSEQDGEVYHYAVRPLQTFDFHGIRIGGLICNDLWANPMYTPMHDPHLSQQLAEMGAQVVFHAVNGGRDGSELSQSVTKAYHESNQRLRAIAGKLWIASVDNSSPGEFPCSSFGGIISPDGAWAYRLPDRGEQLGIGLIRL